MGQWVASDGASAGVRGRKLPDALENFPKFGIFDIGEAPLFPRGFQKELITSSF